MIAELLNTGAAHTRTGRELAAELRCNIRVVTELIEQERQAGKPICAITRGKNAGYYIAETKEDAEAYCESLERRAGAIFGIMYAVKKAAEILPSREELTAGTKAG